MVLLPIASDDVVTDAPPLVTVAVHSVVVPLVNVAVLLAVRGGVAVKGTDWLISDGLAEEVSAIDGVPLLTAWTSESTEVLLLPSPLYVAVMVVLPTASEEVLMVATPLTTFEVPTTVDPPEVKVTVPVTLVGS